MSLWKISKRKNDLRKRLPDVPQTSRRRSGPLSTRRNALVSTRDPVVDPDGLKRASENPETPRYKSPYQNFQAPYSPPASEIVPRWLPRNQSRNPADPFRESPGLFSSGRVYGTSMRGWTCPVLPQVPFPGHRPGSRRVAC